MRMGMFLFGGLLGAFAVVYINRNNGMMMSNLANAGQTVGNMVNKAKSKLSDMNMDMGFSASNSRMNTNTQPSHSGVHSTNSMSQSKSSSNADLSKVEQIVNQDPNLKNKVEEILAENKQTTSAYGMQ